MGVKGATQNNINFNQNENERDSFIKTMALLITMISIVAAVYHIYSGAFRPLAGYQQRALHLLFIFPLGFFYSAVKKSKEQYSRYFDIVLGLLGMAAMYYAYSEYRNLIFRVGAPNQLDLFFGTVSLLLTLELTRRLIGIPLVILGVVSLAYMNFGRYLPGILGHRGYPFNLIIYYQFMTNEGIFGVPLGVAATFIIVFVLLATFLEQAGAGEFFLDFSMSLFGRFRGGPAKVAVVSSSFFGMISGSAAANVAATGSLTIPLMKKTGYNKTLAGAVEALASTGGQYMPPIMGAAAFLMAEILAVPYRVIIRSALIPALLYFGSLLFIVDLEAAEQGLKGLKKEELSDWKMLLRKRGLLLSPLIVIVWALVFARVTPIRAAFYAVASTIIVGIIMKLFTGSGLTLKKIIVAMEDGLKNVIIISTACATAGILVGALAITGLGMKLSEILVSLASGNSFLLLFLTMIASIIMGMGMPTSACYIILAILVAPALVEMGFLAIAAHFFVFYFGVLSNITPPVALAAYAAGGIAGSNGIETAFMACKIGLVTFILPYFFVYGPALLMEGTVAQVVLAVITSILGIIGLCISIKGFLFQKVVWVERFILFIAGLSLIHAQWLTDLLGFTLLIIGIYMHYKRYKHSDGSILKK